MTRSPWYSIAGYTLATATGVMRVLNNRHWISDVLSGAGIGILSTELAYGICDLLFKEKGLLRNDMSYFPDLSKSPSFFSISMGIGLGNKHLNLPALKYEFTEEDDSKYELETAEPLYLKFRSATAVGVEGAWFFNPYVGIGGRLRVKSTPINGWSQFADLERKSMQEIAKDPDFKDAITYFDVDIESDHITEFAADAGIYFSWPLTKRFAIGSKLLIGHSVMDDIEVKATFLGDRLDYDGDGNFIPLDEVAYCEWDYINVHASNSMKFGTGISFTYSHKNSFSWRLFCDYDYARKTYTASYAPFNYLVEFCPKLHEEFNSVFGWDIVQTYTSSARKHLNQWVLGGALCVSF